MQEISYDAAIKEAEELEQQKQTAISDQKYTEVLRIVREQRIFYWRVEKILYSAATRHPDLVLLAKNCKPALETLETFLDAQKAALEIQDITTFNRIRENEIQVLKQLFERIQK